MRDKVSTFRQNFLAEMAEFGHNYDLKGSGLQHREQQSKKHVALLQEELLLLETGE